MEKAKWYKAGDVSEVLEVEPENGKDFKLNELQNFVRGTGENGETSDTVCIVSLPSGKTLVANDNGKLIGLPYNEAASKVWREEFPLEKYTFNNDGILVGNVLICNPRQVK
jgi:hypothetical protein